MTISDYYREARAEARNRQERTTVWRTYALALYMEAADRIDRQHGVFWQRHVNLLGGWPQRWRIDAKTGERRIAGWRKAAGDEALAIRWLPYWRALTDKDLLALEDALIKARER